MRSPSATAAAAAAARNGAAPPEMVQGILQPRNEESLFATWLLKDKGKGATEDRLLVITADRILSITSKAKIAREAHLLELEEIESDSPSTVCHVTGSLEPANVMPHTHTQTNKQVD